MRLIVCLLSVFLLLPAQAESRDEQVSAAFVSGLRAYDNGHYEVAVELLESVLQQQSGCARCAHLLGKSYGKLAERAAWTDAIGLAKKTRIALEHAVALAPNDADAVRDLIKYYRAAPGFLGGSDKKADALERRLRRAGAEHTS